MKQDYTKYPPTAELLSLESNGLHTMAKIEWWLLKYEEHYHRTHKFIYSQHLYEMEDGSFHRFPPTVIPCEKEFFLSLYKHLEEMASFHRLEDSLEKEVLDFNIICNSPSDVLKWEEKNKTTATDLIGFYYDCVDSLDDSNKIMIHWNNGVDVYLPREVFKHTIDFLNIYYNLE